MIVIGLDPGVMGAIAVIEDGHLVSVVDMPTLGDGPKGRRRVNASLVAAAIPAGVHQAYVEEVGVRPGEGAVGAFSFGRGCGVLEGVLAALGVPYSFIAPAAWKRLIGISAGAAKDASRSLAIRTWPFEAKQFARVKDDGRAEAALIALAGIKRSGK